MPSAKKPSRSSGSLTIGFGLVSVPVKVFAGTDEQNVSRAQFSESGGKIRYDKYDEETGERNPTIIKKATATDGTLVVLTDEEIDAAVGKSDGTCEVVGFLPAEVAAAQYVVKDVMQVRPAAGSNKKRVPAFEKAFALLTGAMEASGKVALVEWSLRGKPRYGALTPEGDMLVYYWDDEVRTSAAMPEPTPESTPTEAEMAMAVTLLESMSLEEAPVLTNESVAKVQKYVDAKAAGQPVEEESESTPAGATDLMAALSASLEREDVAA